MNILVVIASVLCLCFAARMWADYGEVNCRCVVSILVIQPGEVLYNNAAA